MFLWCNISGAIFNKFCMLKDIALVLLVVYVFQMWVWWEANLTSILVLGRGRGRVLRGLSG